MSDPLIDTVRMWHRLFGKTITTFIFSMAFIGWLIILCQAVYMLLVREG